MIYSLQALERLEFLFDFIMDKPIRILLMGTGAPGKMLAHLILHKGSNRDLELSIYDVDPEALAWCQEFEEIKVLETADLKPEAFDITVECTGMQAAFEKACESVKDTGVVFLFEGSEETQQVPYENITLCGKELTITTAMAGFSNESAVLMREKAIDYIKTHQTFFKPILGEVIH